MIKRFFFLTLLFSLSLHSQNPYWDSVGAGFTHISTQCRIDTFNSKLVIYGGFKYFNNTIYNDILTYDGTNFDSLGNGIDGWSSWPANVFTVKSYKGKLYVGGAFTQAGGKPIKKLAVWDGLDWDSLPVGCPDGGPTNLFIFNGELYISGSYNNIGTTVCTGGLSKWDGTTLTPIIVPGILFHQSGRSETYNTDLYVGGNSFTSTGNSDILKFDGTNWTVPGGGIKGSLTWVSDVKVFNSKLYVGGLFTTVDGNAGNYLMTWDGANWQKVVDDIDYYVTKLEVWNGKLLVGGCFSNVNGIYTGGLFALDSLNNVCRLSSNLYGCVNYNGIITYGNTFFATGVDSVDGTNFNKIAKWAGGNYTDSCFFAVGINENPSFSQYSINIFPNPAYTDITISIPEQINSNIEIYIFNSLGQQVKTEINWISEGNNQYKAVLSSLATGIYYLKVISGEKVLSQKFIKE